MDPNPKGDLPPVTDETPLVEPANKRRRVDVDAPPVHVVRQWRSQLPQNIDEQDVPTLCAVLEALSHVVVGRTAHAPDAYDKSIEAKPQV